MQTGLWGESTTQEPGRLFRWLDFIQALSIRTRRTYRRNATISKTVWGRWRHR